MFRIKKCFKHLHYYNFFLKENKGKKENVLAQRSLFQNGTFLED